MNLHTGTRMGADKDEVAFLAPSTARESFLVLIAVRPHSNDEKNRSKQLFVLNSDIRLMDAAISSLINIRDSAKDTIA